MKQVQWALKKVLGMAAMPQQGEAFQHGSC